jgi:hypothetical protein
VRRLRGTGFAIRREIAERLALHPANVATGDDPKNYRDKLRSWMDETSAESPDMPDRLWARILSETRTSNSTDTATRSSETKVSAG